LKSLVDSLERELKHRDLHFKDLQLFQRHLWACIVIISVMTIVAIVSLVVVTFCLLRVNEEQKRRLEVQNSKYKGVVQEKNERIQQLERQEENNSNANHGSYHFAQQPIPLIYTTHQLPGFNASTHGLS
jgi:uncharacterized protein YpmS